MARFFAGDVELGKKDDDFKAGGRTPLGAAWTGRKAPARRSVKRVVMVAVAMICLYVFFKNMPKDVQQRGVRPKYIHSEDGAPANSPVSTPQSRPKESDQLPPPPATEDEEESQHTFGGPIKFYALAATLQTISRSQGVKVDNKNVLFAASSLKSASTLIPMACDMALMERNTVHFAYMGRSEVSMHLLRAVNGIDEECDVKFHGMSLEGVGHYCQIADIVNRRPTGFWTYKHRF